MENKRISVGLIILVIIIAIISSIGSVYIYNNFISDSKQKDTKDLKEDNKTNNLEEANNSSGVAKDVNGDVLYFEFDNLCFTNEYNLSCNKTLKITDYNGKSFDVILKGTYEQSYSIQIGNFMYSYDISKNGCGGFGSINAFAFLSNGMFVVEENSGMCYTNKISYYDSDYTFLKKFESQGKFDLTSMSNEYTQCNVHEEIPGDVESQTLSGYRYIINADGTFSNKKVYEYRTMCSSSAE